ncbi:hypothetical protein BHM03_00057986 [Ensete ventricosum]|uniref:Pectinesterase n=1 Tax=Ensete ventricosum TaxID=4639 RepID=A0A445MMJ4_ENSVE|nr:hypothetical protein BHM03_00057986 [Ensete ventricosum]
MAAPTTEPLLSSPTIHSTRLPTKALLLTLSLATLMCLAAFVTIQLTTTTTTMNPPLQPSDLCAKSPNPTSCHAIVSQAMLASTGNLHPTPVQIFRSLLHNSLAQLDAAAASAADIHPRLINEPKQKSALADCMQLLELSRDRIVSSGDATRSDARTWMSAVLTNHATCLDGLDGVAKSAMLAHLEYLKSSASASLAVLHAVPSSVQDNTDAVVKPVATFPSWLSHRDRKLLEMASPNAIQANAVVANDGSGMFKTVQAAVDSVPNGNKNRYVIYVKKGVYKENVSLGKKKTSVMIVGDGMDATVITGSLNVKFHIPPWPFNARAAAVGDGLILQDLKIENTAGPQKHQAVALRVGADRSVINRCRLDGYQDTLYAHSLRQFYRDSFISGTVDFIFGNAAVVFQNCSLIARRPMDNQQNLVTAQGREDPNQNTGTSIQNCQVVPAADLIPVKGSIPSYLGRPWKAYSRTVVMQSYIDNHINSKGWLEWDGEFALKTLFYGEYQNRGPGAGTGGRVNWPGYHVITDANTAKAFTVASLIQGGSWLKETGVAFAEGL